MKVPPDGVQHKKTFAKERKAVKKVLIYLDSCSIILTYTPENKDVQITVHYVLPHNSHNLITANQLITGGMPIIDCNQNTEKISIPSNGQQGVTSLVT